MHMNLLLLLPAAPLHCSTLDWPPNRLIQRSVQSLWLALFQTQSESIPAVDRSIDRSLQLMFVSSKLAPLGSLTIAAARRAGRGS